MARVNGSPPGRVLVVDDNETNREVLVRRLEPQGYVVTTAVNGRDALDRLAAESFDVVLLDIMMPEVNGYQVLERLRADSGAPPVRVIMLTALDEVESVVRCLDLGADDYLTKPINTTLLRARMESSLARKRLRDREALYARSLERELEIGREIQAEFLPATLPAAAGWEFAASLRAARQVGGDFYDAFPIDGSDRIALAVADVCDKGVGAALFMALYRTMLRVGAAHESPGGDTDPAAALRLVNDYIATAHGRSNMFATVSAAGQRRGADVARGGLVVGSGAVKCAAALGLWRVLKREGIGIDMVVGCSGGSIYTAAMALGFENDEVERLTMGLWTREVTSQRDWRGLLGVFMPKLFKFDSDFGLIGDRAMLAALKTAFGDRTFAETAMPLHIVATDLNSGERVVLSGGRVVDAIRASIAVPWVWPAWRVDGRWLVDGCMSDPLRGRWSGRATPARIAVRPRRRPRDILSASDRAPHDAN